MCCLRSRLSVFVYNVCVIGTIPYMELFRAMDTHVQLRTASSDDIEEVVFNCNRRLCYIRGAFFIISIVNRVIFLAQKITCALKT